MILLDIVDANEKKKFIEGNSDFVEKTLPQIEIYKQFVLRVIGDGSRDEQEKKLKSKLESIKEFSLLFMYTEIMHSTQLCFLLKPVNSRHKRDRLHFIIPTGGLQSLCRSRHFWRNMISPVKRSSRFAATAAAGSDRA